MNANLYIALRQGFPQDLDALAIETDQGLRYSWHDLERASAMLANWLDSLQLPEGSRIAVQVDKSVEALMLYLATLRAGHVFLPLNPAYQSAELDYFIGDAEPAVVVCTPANFGWVSKLAFQKGSRYVVTLDEQRGGSLLQRAAHHSDQHTPAMRRADDLAAILYTSGTTGRSKGAMLSHGNLHSSAACLHGYWGFAANDVLLHALPIFHVHGLFVAIHAALFSGCAMLWQGKFEPARVLADLPRATVFMGVPTFYTRLLAMPALNAQACANMRLFISGSAPMLVDTFEQWQQRTGHTVLERYGMSETLMLTSNPYRADDPVFATKHPSVIARSEATKQTPAKRVGGSVGFPLPGVTLRIANPKHQEAALGEVGSIQVKGANVFAGYWRMPEKTAQEFTADGFFITGDMGTRDAEGYVRILGRSKDLIISGGLNVYPVEIEDALNNLPGVLESAVVGVPHPDFGEVGCAFVLAKPGVTLDPAALLQTLKTQLANFKVPKQCVVLTELPRNAMGKVQKNVLRDHALSLRGA
jgi:malonyl-CoA/methylmalonyl-CoA synthetase